MQNVTEEMIVVVQHLVTRKRQKKLTMALSYNIFYIFLFVTLFPHFKNRRAKQLPFQKLSYSVIINV